MDTKTFNKKVAEKYLGRTYPTKLYGDATVVGYEGANRVLIMFADGSTNYCRSGDLKNGEVINPMQPTRSGLGFFGIGPHKHSLNRKVSREYKHWGSMYQRCYDEKFQKKSHTYTGCSVDPQWYNFQEFAEWHHWQKGSERDGWHLDKDIIKKGNRVYSPEFCVLVPSEVNNLLQTNKLSRGDLPIGVTFAQNGKFRAQWQENGIQQYSLVHTDVVTCFSIYKENKERVVKEVANKWAGQIDERVYLTLMAYEVNIND